MTTCRDSPGDLFMAATVEDALEGLLSYEPQEIEVVALQTLIWTANCLILERRRRLDHNAKSPNRALAQACCNLGLPKAAAVVQGRL